MNEVNNKPMLAPMRTFSIDEGIPLTDIPSDPWKDGEKVNLYAADILKDALYSQVKPEDRTPIPLDVYERKDNPFPVEALSDVLKCAVKTIVEDITCPPAIAAMSVLSAASLAVQGHVDFLHPITGKAKPVSLFLLTIAESGERKTTVDDEALKAAKEWEKQLTAYRDSASLHYQTSKDIYETAYDQIKKTKGASQQEKLNAIANLGPKPIAPLTPIITCGEPTIEGLQNLFLHGQPSLGLYSSEGGKFIGSHGMTDDARLRTSTALNSFWDGEAIKRVRASQDDTYMLNGRRLSVHLMIQPNTAIEFLQKADLQDVGLFSRFLVSYPNSIMGTRFLGDKEITLDNPLLYNYHGRLFNLFKRPLPLAQNKINELTPHAIRFTPDAVELWRQSHDDIERLLAKGKRFEHIRGFASKMMENASRIAAVMTAFETIPLMAEFQSIADMTISRDCLQSSLTIMGYFAEETIALFEANIVSPDMARAKKVWTWMFEEWKENYVNNRAIKRHVLHSKSIDKKEIDKVIQILFDRRWLFRSVKGVKVDGSHSNDAWLINRLAVQG